MPDTAETPREFPDHSFGLLTGATVHEEQRACRTVAHYSNTLEEFTEFLDALGIWPDLNYQLYLRTK